jgi:uncharacterized protein YxeA
MPMKTNKLHRILLSGILIVLFTGCYSLKVERINYNAEKSLYEYMVNKNQSTILRNDSGQLITDSNIEQFKKDLEENKYRYPFTKRQENSNYIKNSDFHLTATYSNATANIKSEDYATALKEIYILKNEYPDIVKYSDCLFLEAYCYEKTNNIDSAKTKYFEFLQFSSGKYSERFRGYRDYDVNDSLWIFQRNYAKMYLSMQEPEISNGHFQEVSPKYYYSTYHPGFNLNLEDLPRNTKAHMFLSGGYNVINSFSLGVQTYHKLNDYLDINPGIYMSKNIMGANLALPIQLYLSDNNRFGVKLSPFVNFASIDSLVYQNIGYKIDQSVFNTGTKISLGYYLDQKFSIGAYYTYNLYNRNNHLRLSKPDIDIWWNNVYDISLYYNIFKAFSLKAGVRDNGFVTGLFINGCEMGFDFTNSKFIFIIDLY